MTKWISDGADILDEDDANIFDRAAILHGQSKVDRKKMVSQPVVPRTGHEMGEKIKKRSRLEKQSSIALVTLSGFISMAPLNDYLPFRDLVLALPTQDRGLVETIRNIFVQDIC